MTNEINRPGLHVYLMRHGQTEWSISGQHTGRTDIPLTAHGEDQARALAPRLRNLSFSHVLTSPMARARQTCLLAGLGEAAIIEPALAEWDYGDYEGISSAEIQKTHPGWNIFKDGCPNGETPDQLEKRADQLIARLRDMSGNVALFTHGHFSSVLAVRWIGVGITEGRHFPLATATISVLSYDTSHLDTAVIAQWNNPSG